MFLKNKCNKQRGFGWTRCWEDMAWITQSNSANRLGGGAGNKDTEMVQFHQIPCKSTPNLLADLYLFVHPREAENDQFYVFWSWSLQHANQTSSKPWSPPLDKFWICSNSEVTLREWVCVALNSSNYMWEQQQNHFYAVLTRIMTLFKFSPISSVVYIGICHFPQI